VDERRIRNNQLVFREVNQRIADLTRNHEERESGFICECGIASCTSVIELSLGDYEAVRDGQDFFVVAPGHAVDGVDRLVESRDGFDVVAHA
jgi:hypothetical protein